MRSSRGPSGLGFLVVGLALLGGVSCGDDDDDGGDGTAGNSGTGGDTAGLVTWCQVSEVLVAKCQRCHAGQGFNGAPFPLVTYDDTQVVDAPGPRWQRMESMVEAEAMPPDDVMLSPPALKPTADERDLLLQWFDEGARAVGGTDCD